MLLIPFSLSLLTVPKSYCPSSFSSVFIVQWKPIPHPASICRSNFLLWELSALGVRVTHLSLNTDVLELLQIFHVLMNLLCPSSLVSTLRNWVEFVLSLPGAVPGTEAVSVLAHESASYLATLPCRASFLLFLHISFAPWQSLQKLYMLGPSVPTTPRVFWICSHPFLLIRVSLLAVWCLWLLFQWVHWCKITAHGKVPGRSATCCAEHCAGGGVQRL